MPDNTTTTLTTWVATLINELVHGGAARFVISPGSRNTPLALAIARHPTARIWMHYDERSAGFFALGMARFDRQPVVLVCTSGTAAANYLPAVVEAGLSRIALIVLTADRPHELRDNGAPQTIDQIGIFGRNTRWFSDLPEPLADPAALHYLRSVAMRALAAAGGSPPGPVHLNCPFREPLVPDRQLLGTIFAQETNTPRHVASGKRTLPDRELDRLVAQIGANHRGLILCGPDCPPGLAEPLTRLAARLGYPILADPLSGLRRGPHKQTLVLTAYDAFLRDQRFCKRYVPDLVLRFGAMPTSKPVLLFLQSHPTTHQIVIDGEAGWREPTSEATEHVHADPIELSRAIEARLAGPDPDLTPVAMPLTRWSRPWLSAERSARNAITTFFHDRNDLSEPAVFVDLADLLPEQTTLFVGNSMPIRDCDTFFGSGSTTVTISGNRGANGIDGLVSTGLGLAAAGAEPAVLVLGDLSLYHDSNGLLAARLHQLNATIVLINNDGGGIFSFLPQATEQDSFEQLFGTPHGFDFRPLAELYGTDFIRVADRPAFRAALQAALTTDGLHIIEVRTDRAENVALHRAIWPQVSNALERAGLV
jgi:2-succinyl-5-enolpyruvyl-6-hydroxy-3-cyclohexene-1-carboxylate synthase